MVLPSAGLGFKGYVRPYAFLFGYYFLLTLELYQLFHRQHQSALKGRVCRVLGPRGNLQHRLDHVHRVLDIVGILVGQILVDIGN